jgi:predicted ATPase
MIGRFRAISGYAMKLDRLKSEVIFKPGLNILFGPNACGKSTVLKMIGAYCSINTARGESGWTRFQNPGFDKVKELPHAFKKLSPGGCEAEIEWDGTPTLLADPGISDQTSFSYFYDSKEDSPDGMTGITDQLQMMHTKASSGQMRLVKIHQYYEALKKPPVINQLPKKAKSVNSVWRGSWNRLVEYVNTLSQKGPNTLLLDEPDRSLSIHTQMLFWTKAIPNMAKFAQVIVASHSPFAFTSKDANWIEFEDGYLENSQSLRALI